MGSVGNLEEYEDGKTAKMWRSAVEISEPETVSIEGKLPDWLNGCYYRVGPGKLDLGDDFTMTHWMDGYALLSKFDIDASSQKVTFQSKYLQTDAYRGAMKHQRPVVAEFATPAYVHENKKGFISRLISHIVPEMTDNTNTAFFMLDGSTKPDGTKNPYALFTTNDSGYMNEVDDVNLECKAQLDTSKLFGLNVISPHPLTDPVTNYSYNIGASAVLTGLKYSILRIPPPTKNDHYKDRLNKAKVICTISSQWTSCLSFVHSFGMTKHFIIYIEQPLAINVRKLLTTSLRSKAESSRDWLEWKPDAVNRFYIIDKESGKIINKNSSIISAVPFFYFHFLNCYEDVENNEIIIDLSTYENADVLLGTCQFISFVRSLSALKPSDTIEDELCKNSPKSTRFRIPLNNLGVDVTNGSLQVMENSKAKVTHEMRLTPESIISEGGLELATINPKFIGKPYKYFYASGLMSQGYFKNTLTKVDVERHQMTDFKISDSFIFGEPIFASGNNEEVVEDEGVLIVPMTSIRKSEPDILFFVDAKEMVEIGRAVFKNWIPPAVHGIYISKT